MYRERKRYKPMNSTLRRALYTISKISTLFILFIIYHLTLAPLIHTTLSNRLIASSQRRESGKGEVLTPLIDVDYPTSTIYNLILSESEPSTTIGNEGIFATSDPRVIAMREFLIDYNSPMYPYAEVFIKEADKTGLDWRLLVAISGVESAFGNIIPYGSYNAWGWKGDPTREWSYFNNWADAIQVITNGLATGYGTTLTPFQIEPTYCPPCGATPSHPWANGVSRYMDELQYYVENI